MELSKLTAISPIDGRYRTQIAHLDEYFSEYALMKYRVFVEIEYFLFLAKGHFFIIPDRLKKELKNIAHTFTIKDALAIKTIEQITHHDIKAVEYFLKQKLQNIGAESLTEWIHFGLTAQDINNTAIPLLWKDAINQVYVPAITHIQQELQALAAQWKDIPMLAHTHGQPASPTLLGKELMVFVERIQHQLQLFAKIPFSAKFGGAVGNFNAHHVAFPKKDWVALGNQFVEKTLGLQRQQFTTQIEHYDNLAAQFDTMKRINTILMDLCKDIWTYISMNYFKQKIKRGEVGSSTMPHKINPINFENAEGNLGLANTLFEHLSAKLPISRLQRDLTDSTVLRNVGVPFAHTILAILSIKKGLYSLVLNKTKMQADLEDNWAVIAEAIQTILRRESYPEPYEALKTLTRKHSSITQKNMHQFIDNL
ncbi:MAG TPA: adenylosuccinate lyase, partial [Chitinophagaceae bacterium]|nr:adenylosuccinate lyase [Chitinophagaceae bacterium]